MLISPSDAVLRGLPMAKTGNFRGLLEDMIFLDASDLHLIPVASFYQLTLRRRGRLVDAGNMTHSQGVRLVQALKSATGMNIAESRLPQDGRLQADGVDYRVAVHPCVYGEKMVVRLLGNRGLMSIEQLKLNPRDAETLRQISVQPEGLTLVSGPTGSGKTTLLHAMLNEVPTGSTITHSLEDPIEIINDRIAQTDLSALKLLSTASALKSLMRQDPDCILVGEIRDAETAELVVQAALTGHRVFASIHASDCLGTLFRMTELGVDIITLVGSLNSIVNLRLHHGVDNARLEASILDLSSLNLAERLSHPSLSSIMHQFQRAANK